MQAIYNTVYQIISWICVGETAIDPASPLAYAVPIIALFLCVYCTWKLIKLIFKVIKNLFGL